MTASCKIYKDLLRIAASARREGFLRRFQGDLIRHDKRALKNYCGPYLWGITESSTHLSFPADVCRMRGTSEAWHDLARGYHGRVKIYYSPDGRKPRQVRGAVPDTRLRNEYAGFVWKCVKRLDKLVNTARQADQHSRFEKRSEQDRDRSDDRRQHDGNPES